MLSQLEPATLIRVQTWDENATVPAGLQRDVDAAWPRVTGMAAHGTGVTVLCVNPSEWLLVFPARGRGTPGGALAGTSFRATDVSAALTRLRLEGPHARTVLSKGCSLDLDSPELTPLRAMRTRFAGMPVIVRCVGDAAFDLIVARSYGQYLTDWIADAASEF